MTGAQESRDVHGKSSTVSGLVWYRFAVVYFVVAVFVGVVMGASDNMLLYSVHSHLNLLGWVSLALIGTIYQHVPAIAGNGIARTQFWLYNSALPVMMFALTAKDLGFSGFEPLLAVASTVVALAVGLFALNVLGHGRTRGA